MVSNLWWTIEASTSGDVRTDQTRVAEDETIRQRAVNASKEKKKRLFISYKTKQRKRIQPWQ